MSIELTETLFQELEQFAVIDPHTHINPHCAASETLGDILGYHYYTELAHSAGLCQSAIEADGISPKEKVAALVPKLSLLENTAQYQWLLVMCKEFFDFHEDRITIDNWGNLYDTAGAKMAAADWEQQVLKQSRLDQVYLTNDFDDPLTGFDTSFYVPCLRTDDLVFHLTNSEVRNRLAKATHRDIGTVEELQAALTDLFTHFTANRARACAISLPPDFSPAPVTSSSVTSLWSRLNSGESLAADDIATLRSICFLAVG